MKKYRVNVNGTSYEIEVELMGETESVAPAAPAAKPAAPAAAPAPAGTPELAHTGTAALALGLVAAFLVAGGAIVLRTTRRRRA